MYLKEYTRNNINLRINMMSPCPYHQTITQNTATKAFLVLREILEIHHKSIVFLK